MGALLLYGLYAGALWSVQDLLLFPVPEIERATLDQRAQNGGVATFELQTEDGLTLYGWHARGSGERAVLFFHGNGGGLSTVGWIREQLPPEVDVLGVSYRGYPGSEGAPSEAGMVLDANALWKKATVELGIPPERIVIHGQSMGGGVPVHLASKTKPAAVVLDSTFVGVDLIASERYPLAPTFILNNPFRSRDRAPDIGSPTLVIHGDHDSTIPVSNGRRLAKLIPNATYLEVPGAGHGQFLPDLPEVRPTWLRFVLDALE